MPVYNIDFELMGTGVTLIIMIYFKLRYSKDSLKNRRFLRMTYAILGAQFLDMFTAFTFSYASPGITWLNLLATSGYFYAAAVSSVFSMEYILISVFPDGKKLAHEKTIRIGAVVYAGLFVINAFTGMFFSFDPQTGAYHHGALYLFLYLLPALCLMASTFFLIRFSKNFSPGQMCAAAFFIFTILVSTSIQLLFLPDVYLTFGVVGLAILVVLLSLETPDYQKLLTALEDLEAAKEEAAKASRVKGDFLAQMSHELRTPINAILGVGEMIKRESSESKIQDYAGRIDEAGHTLLRMVNELLSYARDEQPGQKTKNGRGPAKEQDAQKGRHLFDAKGKLVLPGWLNVGITVAVILAVTGILFQNCLMFYRNTSALADAKGRNHFELVKEQLQITLYDAELQTVEVAGRVELMTEQGADRQELMAFLADWKYHKVEESCINVYAAGPDWHVIPDFDAPAEYKASERSWYLGAKRKGGQIYFTPPYIDAMSGEMCYTVSKLLTDGETVVALDFNLSKLQNYVAEIAGTDSDALIVTQDGQIVSFTNADVIGEKLEEALPQYTEVFKKILSSGSESNYFNAEISGHGSNVFYSRTKNNWYLISNVSNWNLYRDSYLQLIISSVAGILLVLFIILLYAFSVQRRRQTENKLAEREAYFGELQERVGRPLREIIDGCDYEVVQLSDSPREYMKRMKESAFHIDDLMQGLQEKPANDAEPKEQEDSAKQAWKQSRHGVKGLKSVESANDFVFKKNRQMRIAVLAILLFTLAFSVSSVFRLIKARGGAAMEQSVDAYYAEFEVWITQQKSVLDMFVSNISANPDMLDDYEGAVKYLNEIKSRYDDISVCYMTNPNAEHTVIMNNGWEPQDENWKVEERSWYIGSMESTREDGFNISEPYFDEQTGLYCVTFSERVYDKNGNFLGNFGIDFYLDKLTEIMSNSYGDTGYAFLVDAGGRIINHPNKNFELNADRAVSVEQAGYLKLIYGQEQVLFRDYDGRTKLGLSHTDALSGFSVIAVRNFGSVYGKMAVYLLIFLVVFSLGIALTWYLLRRMAVWQNATIAEYREETEQARKSGDEKMQFLAQMSHEIRTPINAVLGMNEMIQRESEDANVLTYSDNIQSAGRTLLALINSILDFSKLESGKMELIPVNYETVSLVDDIINMNRERAEKKNLQFIWEIDPMLPGTLYGDDVRVRQIITNLLTNAIKYTKEGSVKLTVRAGERKENNLVLRVSVKDTGIGIKDEDREKLFLAFSRLDETKNRKIEGTGLGIAIVQSLLRMMGSTLVVDSEYGKGSDFHFDLEQRVVEDTPIGTYTAPIARAEHKEAARRYLYAPRARVLIVDDTPMNLMVAQGLLKRSGIQVDTAPGGLEGIDLAMKNYYDVILLDHMMPEPDGIETLRLLKAGEALDPRTKVIVMTANAVAGAKEQYLQEGFDGYLAKPVDAAELEKMLAECLPGEKVSYLSKDDARPEAAGSAVMEPPGSLPTATPEPAVTEALAEEAGLAVTEALAEALGQAASRIDRSVGMKYAGDDAAFYKELLQVYISAAGEKQKELENALAAGDCKNYTVYVHSLKSSSKTIGAMNLAEHALELEKAGKAEDLDFLQINHDLLMYEFEEVLHEAERIRDGL